MNLRKGNMWDPSQADMIVVTGNALVRFDGSLVMGRGAAKEATQYFPDCAKRFGKLIKARMATDPLNPYGFLVIWYPGGFHLGLFQVKNHWQEDARLDLIQNSVKVLNKYITGEGSPWHDRLIYMNFPGIGNGRLSRAAVLPLIESLPDNVVIWEKA